MTLKYDDGHTQEDAKVYTCVFLCPVDIPEARKILGVTTCPCCNVHGGSYHDIDTVAPQRTLDAVKEVILQAKDLNANRKSQQARQLLQKHTLSALHLDFECPWFQVPLFTFQMFVPDDLHEL